MAGSAGKGRVGREGRVGRQRGGRQEGKREGKGWREISPPRSFLKVGAYDPNPNSTASRAQCTRPAVCIDTLGEDCHAMRILAYFIV